MEYDLRKAILIAAVILLSFIGLFVIVPQFIPRTDGPDPTPPSDGIFADGPAWKVDVHDVVVSGPTSDGKLVFVRTRSRIVAVDFQTKREVWSIPSSWPLLGVDTYPMVVSGDYLLISDKDGTVGAYSVKDGHLIWKDCNACNPTAPVDALEAI